MLFGIDATRPHDVVDRLVVPRVDAVLASEKVEHAAQHRTAHVALVLPVNALAAERLALTVNAVLAVLLALFALALLALALALAILLALNLLVLTAALLSLALNLFAAALLANNLLRQRIQLRA